MAAFSPWPTSPRGRLLLVATSFQRVESASSPHHQVDPGEDRFHLSLRQFANPLGQLLLVDGDELSHIRDRIPVESGLLGQKQNVSGGDRTVQIARQRNVDDRRERAAVESIGLHGDDGPSIARAGTDGLGQVGPPDLALVGYHSVRRAVCRAAAR